MPTSSRSCAVGSWVRGGRERTSRPRRPRWRGSASTSTPPVRARSESGEVPPERIAGDVGDDDLTHVVRGGAAGADRRADRNAVDRLGVRPGKARSSSVTEVDAIPVEQQDRREHPVPGAALDEPRERLEHGRQRRSRGDRARAESADRPPGRPSSLRLPARNPRDAPLTVSVSCRRPRLLAPEKGVLRASASGLRRLVAPLRPGACTGGRRARASSRASP